MNHSMPLLPWPRRPAARRAALSAALCAALCATPAVSSGANAYLGELMLFGGDACPQGWLPADGRLVNITEFSQLFPLLGTVYGGNGSTTFALPDLRGRAAVGTGVEPLGKKGGAETVTLQAIHLPPHTHSLPASTQPATHAAPAPGRVLATAQNGGAYASVGTGVDLQTSTIPDPQPFSVRSPFLAMQWCVATSGAMPEQN